MCSIEVPIHSELEYLFSFCDRSTSDSTYFVFGYKFNTTKSSFFDCLLSKFNTSNSNFCVWRWEEVMFAMHHP